MSYSSSHNTRSLVPTAPTPSTSSSTSTSKTASSTYKAIDPVAKAGDYKSIAAQYARAKTLKETEDREAAQLTRKVDAAVRSAEEITKQKSKIFRRAWLWSASFWIWLFFIHATGIFLFTKGFLLTRLVLDETSACGVPPIPIVPPFRGSGTPEAGCWHPRTFEKAVVVVVDALRYDFTVPFNSSSRFPSPQIFHNSLPFLYETAIDSPQNAFLLPFIADPPTSTLQRLKGLTTGTLPTFIDIGSSFSGTAIEEDNLLSQLRSAGRKIVHLGDDTWQSLFPGYFEEDISHAYDSFNVWDLHTVDNGVTEHIIPLLKGESAGKGDWDVVFAHYLGVDHAGHRYGPDHPAMAAKLQQMDGVLRDVVAALDDDTLLVVMGDHGMDSKGDHGGESDDEIEAALWMYSKKGVFGRTDETSSKPPPTAKERPVGQIDLVPTLALLLGLPIPFNNLGTPIKEAFIGSKNKAWENLAAAVRMTSAGVHRYQKAYFAVRGVEESTKIDGPLDLWNKAISATPGSSIHGWKMEHEAFSAYQKRTLQVCRDLWARFDIPSMIQGVSILAGGLLVLLIFIKNVADDDDAVVDTELERAERRLELEGVGKDVQDETVEFDFAESTVTGALIGTLAGASLGITVSFMSPDGSIVDEGLLAAAAGGLLGALASQVGSIRYVNPLPSNLWTWLSIIFCVSQSVGFASNSYTIWEDSILLFFLSSFSVVTLISSLRLTSVRDRTLGVYHSALFLFLTWASSFSRLCREEQMPYCRSTYYASATSSTSAWWQLTIPFLVALLLPNFIKAYYATTRSYEGFAPLWINIAFRGGLLAAAIFWVLDAADDGEWFPSLPKSMLKSTRVVLAQTIFALALAAGTITFGWVSPCVSISTKPATTTGGKSTVTVLGYANAHGSRYFLYILNFVLATLMVTKPMGWLSLSLLTWQLLSLVEILDILSLTPTTPSAMTPGTTNTPTTLSPLTLPTTIASIGPTILALLAQHHFFKTGHTATLSSIQWESAFVPLRTIIYPYSPLLVALNTFGAHLLCSLAVPLTVFWKGAARQNPRLLANNLARAWGVFVAYWAVQSLATTMWAAHLRRHLMLYRVFMPRFMVGAAVLLVVDLVGLVLVLGATWINVGSVVEVFGWS